MSRNIRVDGRGISFSDFVFEDDRYGFIGKDIVLDFGGFDVECYVSVSIERVFSPGDYYTPGEYEYSEPDIVLSNIKAYNYDGDWIFLTDNKISNIKKEIVNYLCDALLY